MKIRQWFNKFYRNLSDYGVTVALRKTFSRLFQFAYTSRVYRIYGIDLTKYAAKHRDGNGFLFRVINESCTDCVSQIETMEEWLEGNVAHKIVNGAICLVAMDHDSVAGFNIAASGGVAMPLVRLRRTFREGSAWSEQITVHKRYRGRGLGSELRYRMFEELSRRGYRKFYGGTLKNNKANLQLSRKVGFREIADIRVPKGVRRRTLDRGARQKPGRGTGIP